MPNLETSQTDIYDLLNSSGSGAWVISNTTDSHWIEILKSAACRIEIIRLTPAGTLDLGALTQLAQTTPVSVVWTPVNGLASVIKLSQMFNFKIVVEQASSQVEEIEHQQWLPYADAIVTN